jgi:hypothetical protein
MAAVPLAVQTMVQQAVCTQRAESAQIVKVNARSRAVRWRFLTQKTRRKMTHFPGCLGFKGREGGGVGVGYLGQDERAAIADLTGAIAAAWGADDLPALIQAS